MIDTKKIKESKRLESIRLHPSGNLISDQLKNEEFTGHFLPIDPDNRNYFMKCPYCQRLILDNGLYEKIKCDTCKKIIIIPENNFQEIKQNNLYSETKRKKPYCKIINNICKKMLYFIPFINSNIIYALPSFKHVVFYINKEKLDNSSHHTKNFKEIMNNIIIPFFQYKSRFINLNRIFEIDGIEFKVISVSPHYLTGKVTSKTSIVCNNYYSLTTPIENATFLTIRKRESESNDYISNKIINTPFPSQKSINEGLNCRINTYDLIIRNCFPKYGIITNTTNVRVINRNIETIKKMTIAILHNEENSELNNIKNNKLIFNNFIHPFFYYGNKRYVERGDVLDIGKLKIFILKSRPSTGFVIEDFTKIKIKFDYTLEQAQNELNEQIEIESLKNRQNRYLLDLNTNLNNTNNGIINSSLNSENNLVILNEFQERMRLLNALLAHRRRLLRIAAYSNNILNNLEETDNFSNINFNRHRGNHNRHFINENTLNSLPVFQIDEKFMEVSQKEENKNEHFEKCVICMEKYKLKDEVKTLPCFHIFHKDCIDHWFKEGNDSCPICKNKINNNNYLDEDFKEE